MNFLIIYKKHPVVMVWDVILKQARSVINIKDEVFAVTVDGIKYKKICEFGLKIN